MGRDRNADKSLAASALNAFLRLVKSHRALKTLQAILFRADQRSLVSILCIKSGPRCRAMPRAPGVPA